MTTIEKLEARKEVTFKTPALEGSIHAYKTRSGSTYEVECWDADGNEVNRVFGTPEAAVAYVTNDLGGSF